MIKIVKLSRYLSVGLNVISLDRKKSQICFAFSARLSQTVLLVTFLILNEVMNCHWRRKIWKVELLTFSEISEKCFSEFGAVGCPSSHVISVGMDIDVSYNNIWFSNFPFKLLFVSNLAYLFLTLLYLGVVGNSPYAWQHTGCSQVQFQAETWKQTNKKTNHIIWELQTSFENDQTRLWWVLFETKTNLI